MTRIVAGAAKGRRLVVPAGGTRPTSERTREALFNTLRAHVDVDGAAVLDLYAGSGAVGLEALSRGARSADLVESDRAAAAVITRNVASVGLPGARVHRRTVLAFLEGVARPVGAGVGDDRGFDLVFADPPYDLGQDDLGAVLPALVPHLAASAVVVVERSSRTDEPSWPPGIDLVTQRAYGDARLWYGRRQ